MGIQDASGRNIHVIDHFDDQASVWASKYDPDGRMGFRVGQFLGLVEATCTGHARGIDLGCGTGNLAAALSRAGFPMVGVDISEKMVDQAVRRYGDDDGLRFQHINRDQALVDLPEIEPGRVDFVTASSVLEYVGDVGGLARNVRTVLHGSGVFLLTVPSVKNRRRRVEGYIRNTSAIRSIFLVVGRLLGGRWRRYVEYLCLSKNRWSVEGWQRVIEPAGFVLSRVVGEDEDLVVLVFDAR